MILLYFVYFSISINIGAFKLKKLNHLSEIYSLYDTFIIDLWGVIHNGVQLNEAAIEVVKKLTEHKKKVIFLSNAPRPSSVVKNFLKKLKMNEEYLQNIVTSGEAAMIALNNLKFGNSFFHLGPVRDNLVYEKIQERKTSLENSDFIICTGLFDDQKEDLKFYTELLKDHKKKKMICTNPDLIVHKGEIKEYCAGSIAKTFEELGGEVIYFGKPYEEIYKICFNDNKRVLAVGDNLKTDIKGANNMKIESVFITGGIHRSEFKSEKDLEKLLIKYKVKANYFQNQLSW